MKKTGMAKSDAKKLMGKMSAPGQSGFDNASTAPVPLDRREQRKIDQAQGLVPFAVKLDSALVSQLQDLATQRAIPLNALVAEVLLKGLAV